MAAGTTPNTFPVNSAGAWLRADAAASYLRMLAAGMPAGGVDVFGRTLAQQKKVYQAFLSGHGPLAAKPSPTAPHVRGLAMDLHTSAGSSYDPSDAHLWLTDGGDGSKRPQAGEKLHAHGFGWRRTVPSERWHFGYDRSADTKRAADLAGRLEKLGFPDVTAFQRGHGLDDDGVDGPATWAALLGAGTPSAQPSATPLHLTLPVPTLARIVTFNCAAFGHTSMTASQIDAIVGALLKMAGSIYTLSECPEWLRNHIRGVCSCAPGAHRTIGDQARWRVAIRGDKFSQAILFDSWKWSYLGASGGQFGPTSYHGYLIAGLQQTITRAIVTVSGYHLPPNVVASDDFQKAALGRLLDLMPAGGPRVLGGDGADKSSWVNGWDDARVIAESSPNRDAITYEHTIRDRIHSREITVRKYTVIPSDGASDHAGVLTQITIPGTAPTL